MFNSIIYILLSLASIATELVRPILVNGIFQEFVFHWNLKWLRWCFRRKCQNLASVSSHRSNGQMDQIEGKWGNRSKIFQMDFSKEPKLRKLSAKGEYEAMSLGANIRRSGYHHTIQGHSEWMKKNQKVKQCAQASTFTMVAFSEGFRFRLCDNFIL